MHRVLLVLDGDEAHAGGREDVQGVHEGGADNAEDVGDAVSHQRLRERLAARHLQRKQT